MGRYVPTERVRTVSTYRPSGYVRKEAGDTQHNTAQHNTGHYTAEGTADSGTQGTHARGVGLAQEDTNRPTEGKKQV